MKKILLYLVIFLLSTNTYSYIAQQEIPEQIYRFVSHINVLKNDTLDISENFTVYLNSSSIENGFTRTLPLQNNYFSTQHYKIKKVLLNNVAVPYHITKKNNLLLIQIPLKTNNLKSGVYTYTIEYQVNHVIDFANQVDHLNWNILSEQGKIPIQYAEVSITLPVSLAQYRAFVTDGKKEYSFLKVIDLTDKQITFGTTQPLILGRSINIDLTWPSGYITPPSTAQLLGSIIANHARIITCGLIMLLLILIWPLSRRFFNKSRLSFAENVTKN